ncbi:MAG: hypothetical protein JOY79_04750 [Acidobacteriaceae bacterium]|nr:hypothetical protein [Acidobacteriaceae bacterium]
MLPLTHHSASLETTHADLAPDLALRTFEERQHSQMSAPPSYSAEVVVDARVPASSQQGKFALRRRFIAPKTLEFTPIEFTGDNFVKTNVITRVLQSEVDHVKKGEGATTAINDENYRFIYRGTEVVDGASTHVYQVKPRKKRVGLFKGRIFINSATGDLQRAEGVLVKSPSLFIKRIGFVQDYTTVAGYTLPKHIYSVAGTRLVGQVVVDISTSDYELLSSSDETAASAATTATRKGSE